MKKVLPFLLLVFMATTLIVSSCKKDPKIEPVVASDKWLMEKAFYEMYDTAGTLLDTQTVANWTVNDYLSLRVDGKFELVQRGRILTGTYVMDSSYLTLTYPQNASAPSVTASLKATIVEKTDHIQQRV